jgi:glycosyltransferase involved in cell wall biosynthesis
MEAWDLARPVLVNGDCAVLKDHVVNCGGGLYYRNHAEFDASLQWMLAHPETREAFGRHGQAYVRSHFDWEQILGRFEREVFV